MSGSRGLIPSGYDDDEIEIYEDEEEDEGSEEEDEDNSEDEPGWMVSNRRAGLP